MMHGDKMPKSCIEMMENKMNYSGKGKRKERRKKK